ncbi:MAG: FAD-binding protein, partial [Thermodesulfobacteriota bacterium]
FLGIDAVTQMIPVRPTQHYSMGGVRTDKDGAAYGLKGLFAAGEAACWDMHGFNRLGGNSLAETIVAGKIVGEKVADFLEGYEVEFKTESVHSALKRDGERIERLIQGRDGKENVFDLRKMMQDALMEGVGIFRNQQDLQQAVDTLQVVYARSHKIGLKSNGLGANPELSLAIRFKGMVRLALCIAYGALVRTESRGCHAREDFLERNDRDWLKRTLATWKEGDTLPTFSYEPNSQVWELPPGDRGYGSCKIICSEDPQVCGFATAEPLPEFNE